MKRILFFLLFVACVQQTAFAQSKIAHANFQVLADTIPSRKAAVADITRIQIEGQQELIKMKTDFEKQATDYQNKIIELSPAIRGYEESRLQKMQNDIITREQELTEMIQRLAEESDTKTLNLVQKAVEIVAKKKGLNYVLPMNSLLYAGGTDLTNEIIPELLLLDKQQSTTVNGNGQ